jgi:hypothetical protein
VIDNKVLRMYGNSGTTYIQHDPEQALRTQINNTVPGTHNISVLLPLVQVVLCLLLSSLCLFLYMWSVLHKLGSVVEFQYQSKNIK